MRISKYLLIGILSLVTGPVLADSVPLRDLTVEQASAAQAGFPRPGSLQVSVSADRPDATYVIGETVRLTLMANEDSYVTVLSIGPTGQVTQLFPNQYQSDARVFANRPLEIASANAGARVTVAGPVGTELIKVVASSKPLTVVSEAQLQGRGVFRSVDGGVPAVLRDLQVVADQAAQSDAKIFFANYTLHTIGSRLPAASGQPMVVVVPGQGSVGPVGPSATTILPVTAPQGPSTSINVPSQQPFPLLIAADKTAYKVGEKVILAVTTLQACSLTVMDVSPSGQVRTLFPNQTTPNNAIGAHQTVLVAGGSSAISLAVSGPTGTEQILAICSTDSPPIVAQASSDRAALTRDLAVVVARPAGTTAIASLTFTVQP